MHRRGGSSGKFLRQALLESLESRRLLSADLVDGVLGVTGTSGDDNIRISISKDTSKLAVKLDGTATLFSLASINKIKVDGLGGDDTICIRQHRGQINIATELNGGDGDDQIFGGNGNDVISGGAGDDVIRGNGGDDVLFGGVGTDKISGGRGNDSLLGGAGVDKLRGGAGIDVSNDSGRLLLDMTKPEKRRRFAPPPPIWQVQELSSDSDPGNSDDDVAGPVDGIQPIWWDPEANTDDSGNPIDVPNAF